MFMSWEAINWLFWMVVFLAVEGASVSLVSIWFAGGSLVAMIAALLGVSFGVQVIIFFAVSCLLLAMLRPMVRRYITPKITKTNMDAVLGKQVLVTAAVNNLHGCGTVKINGVEWTARSTNNDTIEAGTQVTIDRIEGVKVFVTPVEEKEKV
jgi:membrane protein implicated in regulation of membrane protease activity